MKFVSAKVRVVYLFLRNITSSITGAIWASPRISVSLRKGWLVGIRAHPLWRCLGPAFLRNSVYNLFKHLCSAVQKKNWVIWDNDRSLPFSSGIVTTGFAASTSISIERFLYLMKKCFDVSQKSLVLLLLWILSLGCRVVLSPFVSIVSTACSDYFLAGCTPIILCRKMCCVEWEVKFRQRLKTSSVCSSTVVISMNVYKYV